MKKKFSLILGVMLTLMLLASLFGFAVPAAAAPGAWTPQLLPALGALGNYAYDPAFTNAQYITQGIDGALYCYDNRGAGTTYLYKSVDDGRNWTRVAVNLVNVVMTDIVCSSVDANTLWVATGAAGANMVYVSINGGVTFTALVPNALVGGTAVITSIDVGYLAGNPYIFMATADPAAGFGGLYTLGPTYGAAWSDMMITNGANATAVEETVVDVYEVKCAPDFSTSQLVIGVVSAGAAQNNCVTKYGGANWNVGALAAAAAPAGVVTVPTSAEIAFPGNFNSSTASGLMEYFVAFDTGGAGTGDVFRIINATAFDRNIGGIGTATDVTGLDMVGDVGTASIMAGRADALGVRTSTNYGASWALSAKAPVGTAATIATWVVMADDFASSGKAWAATSGVDSGVYLTVNSGVGWNGVGLLDTDITLAGGAAIQDFDIGVDSNGAEIIFVAINTAAGNENLWRFDGANWEQIWADGLGMDVDLVSVSDTFTTDSIVFFADNTLLRILRSFDQGGIWIPQLSAVPAAFAAWLIVDANTVLVGNNAGNGLIYRTANNGTTWVPIPCGIVAASIASLAKSPDYANDSTVAAGTTAGFVVLSATGGLSYAQAPAGGVTLGAGNTFVTFNQQDATVVYAITANANAA